MSGKVSQFNGNQSVTWRVCTCRAPEEVSMANPKQDNPNPKPQDDQRQGGRDPLGKVQDPRQEGQGRDPMKDPDRQRGGETDQRKQGDQNTRKPT